MEEEPVEELDEGAVLEVDPPDGAGAAAAVPPVDAPFPEASAAGFVSACVFSSPEGLLADSDPDGGFSLSE